MATKTNASLAKGLHILQEIALDDGRSSLVHISDRLGIPLATAHRLVLTLVAEGFIERERSGLFLSGPSLRYLLQWAGKPTHLSARLRRPLGRLAKKYNAFTHFGCFDDGMVTYLIKEKGLDKELFTEEHTQLEAYCSAIGKVLLAALAPDQLDAYLADGPFTGLTARTLTEPAAIRRELDDVRAKGVAFDRYEIRDDLFCIGVRVVDHSGSVVGGVSISIMDRVPEPIEVQAMEHDLRKVAKLAIR